MMLSWWVYAAVVAFALALAGGAVERVAWSRNRPSRGIWALSLALAGGWPLLLWLQGTASGQPGGNAGATAAWFPKLGALLAPVYRRLPDLDGWLPAAYRRLPELDAWLAGLWLLGSVLLLTLAVVSHGCLAAATRRCRRARICGVGVWLSPTDGPAAVGLLRPGILMPHWIVAAPAGQRRLALLHELNHLRAGDLPLVAVAYLVACAMPWNPAAWWMFGRLRRAVEIDCDRRVLARHDDRRAYGELLVRTAEVRSTRLGLASGLLARRTRLRRRLEHIGSFRRGGRAGPRGWAPVAAATACLLLAAAVPAPAVSLAVARVTGQGSTLSKAAGRGVYRMQSAPQTTAEPTPLREVRVGAAGELRAAGRARFGPDGENGLQGGDNGREDGDPQAAGGGGVVRARPHR